MVNKQIKSEMTISAMENIKQGKEETEWCSDGGVSADAVVMSLWW